MDLNTFIEVTQMAKIYMKTYSGDVNENIFFSGIRVKTIEKNGLC